jgi:hypothetical protein
MKAKTREYIIAGFYLALIVTVVATAFYSGWYTLLQFSALCLAGYGAFKLLDQTAIGRKLLELVLVVPVVILFMALVIGVAAYPLGASLGWSPWFYINDLPVYGSEIFKHPGMAVFVLGIEVFWGSVIALVLRVAWKKSQGRV